jgi:hypothetical protein
MPAEPIRFFMYQHFPGPASQGLRRHGADVLTAREAGRCGLPDADQPLRRRSCVALRAGRVAAPGPRARRQGTVSRGCHDRVTRVSEGATRVSQGVTRVSSGV